MTLAHLPYRIRQFWLNLSAQPSPGDLAQARQALSPALYELFCRMQPGEQVHSLNVLHALQEQGHTDPDLLAAALLHDCGKSLHPLRLWERAWIVLAQAFAPGLVKAAAASTLPPEQMPFWRRPLAVAAGHPAWGARLAGERGAAPLLMRLIAVHQSSPTELDNPAEARLLTALQAVDNKN